MKKIALLAVLLLTCAGCPALNKEFVRNERDMYNAIVPRYEASVKNDPTLSADEKKFLLETPKAWDAKLKKEGF